MAGWPTLQNVSTNIFNSLDSRRTSTSRARWSTTARETKKHYDHVDLANLRPAVEGIDFRE